MSEVKPIAISIMSNKKEGGDYPKEITKEGKTYKLVKVYNNHARYERTIKNRDKTIKIQECFNRFDVGVIEYRKVDRKMSVFYKYVNW